MKNGRPDLAERVRMKDEAFKRKQIQSHWKSNQNGNLKTSAIFYSVEPLSALFADNMNTVIYTWLAKSFYFGSLFSGRKFISLLFSSIYLVYCKNVDNKSINFDWKNLQNMLVFKLRVVHTWTLLDLFCLIRKYFTLQAIIR